MNNKEKTIKVGIRLFIALIVIYVLYLCTLSNYVPDVRISKALPLSLVSIAMSIIDLSLRGK